MPHDSECLPGVHHLAVLNLFREADGSVQITVGMADGAIIEYNALSGARDTRDIPQGKPIDYIEGLIVRAADTMAARRKPPLDRSKL